jgi:hypothetical protein
MSPKVTRTVKKSGVNGEATHLPWCVGGAKQRLRSVTTHHNRPPEPSCAREWTGSHPTCGHLGNILRFPCLAARCVLQGRAGFGKTDEEKRPRRRTLIARPFAGANRTHVHNSKRVSGGAAVRASSNFRDRSPMTGARIALPGMPLRASARRWPPMDVPGVRGGRRPILRLGLSEHDLTTGTPLRCQVCRLARPRGRPTSSTSSRR